MISSSLSAVCHRGAERAAALEPLGFTPRQARFLTTVMVHAGVFVERQYCAFAGIRHGQNSTGFLHKLLQHGYAREIQPGPRHRGRLFHVHHKALYRAIGLPDNRHRRRAPLGRLVERLMVLDAVLDHPDRTWLGTERDKAQYFLRRLAEYRFDREELPHRTYRSGDRETLRLFPDKLPIAVDPIGDQYVFLYLATRRSPVEFRGFLTRHLELWRPLRTWQLRVLVPAPLATAIPAYRRAAREELITPLSPSDTEELEWYFGQRERVAGEPAVASTTRFVETARRFHFPRFDALFRSWQEGGPRVLWGTQSPVLADAFARGNAALEFVVLPRSYLHLTSLVGLA